VQTSVLSRVARRWVVAGCAARGGRAGSRRSVHSARPSGGPADERSAQRKGPGVTEATRSPLSGRWAIAIEAPRRASPGDAVDGMNATERRLSDDNRPQALWTRGSICGRGFCERVDGAADSAPRPHRRSGAPIVGLRTRSALPMPLRVDASTAWTSIHPWADVRGRRNSCDGARHSVWIRRCTPL